MALAYVNAHTVSTSGGATAVTNAVPSGVATGDLMLWTLSGSTGTAVTTPTGWLVWEATLASGALGVTMFYRVATGSEPANYTATVPTGRWSGSLVVFRGQHTVTPKDTANQTVVDAANVTPPAITTTTNDAWVVAVNTGLTANGVASVTWTSTNTLRSSVTSISDSATNASQAVATTLRSTPGATTPNLTTSTVFGRGAAITSAIRAATGTTSVVSASRSSSWAVQVPPASQVTATRATSWAVDITAGSYSDTYADVYEDDLTGPPITPPNVELGGTAVVTTSTQSTTANPTLSGFVDGDWVVLVCQVISAGSSLIAPAGYTTILASTQSAASSHLNQAVFARRYVTGDTLSPTVSSPVTARFIVVPLRVTNAEPVGVAESAAIDPNTSSATNSVRAPALTAVESRLLVSVFGARNNTTGGAAVLPFTTPAGMTRLVQHETASTINTGMMVAVETLTAGGSTGTRTSTAASPAAGTQAIGSSILIRPLSAPPVKVTAARATTWVTASLGTTKVFTGSTGPSGDPGRLANKRPAGTVAAAAVVNRAMGRTFTATVTATSIKVKRLPRVFAATVAATGFMQRGFPRKVVGSLTGSGVVGRGPQKRPVGSVATSSTLRRPVVTKLLASAVTAAGGLYRNTVARTFTGSTAAGAAMSKRVGRIRAYAGSIGVTATARKTVTVRNAGSSAPSTLVRRRARLTLRATIATAATLFNGFYQRVFGRSGTATITLSPRATAEIHGYLRNRATIRGYTIADALMPGEYYWQAQGLPARPATTPLPPTALSVVAGNTQATVSFAKPISDGGSKIIRYTVYASNGQVANGDSSPIVVGGLPNGAQVTFVVTATNAVGEGVASDVSAPVVPQAGRPDAPTSVQVIRGNGQITVSFVAPANNGGSPITSYIVNVSTGQTVTGTTSPIAVPNLPNGVPVTVTVSAVTAAGTSAPSERSASVTPSTVPGAPVIGTASAGSGQATVRWSPPTSNGGAPVTIYTVTTYVGATNTVAKTATVDGESTSTAVTGLANGTAYSFTVTAGNVAGTGAASARSNLVTPAAAVITVLTPTTTVNASQVRSVVLRKPAGAAQGHLLVASLSTNAANVSQVPSGWSLVASVQSSGLKLYAYYRVLTAADNNVTSWTWTLADGVFNAGGIQGYVGVSATDPVDRVESNDDDNATVAVSITTTEPNGMLVGVSGSNSSNLTMSQPPGWAEDYDLNNGSKHNSQGHYAYTAAGSGTYTWKASGDRPTAAIVLALRRG